MNNLRSTKIGLATLTIIFLVLYGYFSTLGKPLANYVSLINQGFSINKVTLGNLGGFHILKNIGYTEEPAFYRLLIETELNRSTASPEAISIPYLSVEEPLLDNAYQIKVNLSDTEIDGSLKDNPAPLMPQASSSSAGKLITDLKINTVAESTTEISITLAKQALFRVTSDTSGTIVLDILK